jgi:hypothetical protein
MNYVSSEIPDEIWMEIFSYFSAIDLLRVNSVSKSFQTFENNSFKKFLKKQIPSFSIVDEKVYYFKIIQSKNYQEEYEKSIWELNYEKPTELENCERLTFHELIREIFTQKNFHQLKILLYMFEESIDVNILFLKLNNLSQCEDEEIKKNVTHSIHYFIKNVGILCKINIF